MGRYGGWLVGVGVISWAGLVGCQSARIAKQAPVPRVADKPERQPARGERELPPLESAQLCLEAAEEMEKSGETLQAIVYYEKARHQDPRLGDTVGPRLAVLYDREGNWALALREYQKALERHPEDPDLLNDLGYGYYCRGSLAEAEDYLHRAVKADPKHERAWTNLGMVLASGGNHQAGLEAFARVLPEANALCNLAFILTAKGQHTEARRAYCQALVLDPDLPIARAALAKLEKMEKDKALRQVGGTAEGAPGKVSPSDYPPLPSAGQ